MSCDSHAKLTGFSFRSFNAVLCLYHSQFLFYSRFAGLISSAGGSHASPPYSSIPLHTLPLALQIFLPKTNPIIARTNSQHIPAQTPAHAPQHNLKRKTLQLHTPGLTRLARPDAHCLILGGRSDVALLQHRRTPRHVAHPVRVSRQRLPLLLVGLRGLVEGPEAQHVVASACYEAPYAALLLASGGGDERARRGARRPGHRVHAHAVRVEDLVVHGVVFEF